MMNLNAKQILAIILAILSVFSGSAAQLTDLFGTGIAKILISASSLASTALSSVLAVLSSQGSLVRDVAAMPGVERINVNASASQALAAVATDPNQPKVGATTPEVREVLKDTVKGN